MVERPTLKFKAVIGRGGFGTVYRATLTRGAGFQKEVAVKVLHDEWVRDPAIAPRLRDEARVLGLLRHRALPSVDGLFWVEGRPALVTEYVEGVTVHALARSGVLPVGVALEVCAEVAGALHAAYTREGPDGRPLCLVHRDIKPSNVQITPVGEVKLLDFGIARADFAARESDTSGHVLGSLRFMSPERLDLLDGPQSDVYSLAILLVEILTGSKFKKTSADRERHAGFCEAVLATLDACPPGPDGVAPAVLRSLIQSLLSYDPDERPNARDLERRCRDLRRVTPGALLGDWAEAAVAAASAVPRELEDPSDLQFVGRSLTVAFKSETMTPAPRSGRAPAPTTVRPTVAALGGAVGGAGVVLVATLFLAAFLVVLAVAFVFGGLADPRLAQVESPAPTVLFPVAVEPVPNLSEPVPALSEPVPVAVEPVPDPSEPIAAPTEPIAPVAAPAPTPVQPGAAPAPAPASPRPPSPTAASPNAGSVVTASSFSSWLASSPEWSRDQAVERRRADAGYLEGWSGATPPPGATFAVPVSWHAAQAFCRDRGGLPPVDGAPTTWDEAKGPFQEWRIAAGGAAAWRRFDGVSSTAVRRTDANAFTGFRCAR